MKLELDKKSKQTIVTAVIIVFFSLIVYELKDETASVIFKLFDVISSTLSVLKPFLIAFFLCILINPMLKGIERFYKKVFKEKINAKNLRAISLVTSYAFVFIILYFVLIAIIPNALVSIPEIISNIPNHIASSKNVIQDFASSNYYNNLIDAFTPLSSLFDSSTIKPSNNPYFEDLFQSRYGLQEIINIVYKNTLVTAVFLIQFILAIAISYYLLTDKEYFIELATKLLLATIGQKNTKAFIQISKNANTAFENFFMGKIIDSIIMGLLFFIVGSLLGLEHMVLCSTIFAITNMIPYFGPFIGAAPIIIIELSVGLNASVIVSVLILILQQFDGIVLGPKILGSSVSVKPIGIVFAILVGGSLYGFIGMFFAVPVFSVFSRILIDLIDSRSGNLVITEETEQLASIATEIEHEKVLEHYHYNPLSNKNSKKEHDDKL